jgi:hypothetical protein
MLRKAKNIGKNRCFSAYFINNAFRKYVALFLCHFIFACHDRCHRLGILDLTGIYHCT